MDYHSVEKVEVGVNTIVEIGSNMADGSSSSNTTSDSVGQLPKRLFDTVLQRLMFLFWVFDNKHFVWNDFHWHDEFFNQRFRKMYCFKWKSWFFCRPSLRIVSLRPDGSIVLTANSASQRFPSVREWTPVSVEEDVGEAIPTPEAKVCSVASELDLSHPGDNGVGKLGDRFLTYICVTANVRLFWFVRISELVVSSINIALCLFICVVLRKIIFRFLK